MRSTRTKLTAFQHSKALDIFRQQIDRDLGRSTNEMTYDSTIDDCFITIWLEVWKKVNENALEVR